jgi:hypothetical protein
MLHFVALKIFNKEESISTATTKQRCNSRIPRSIQSNPKMPCTIFAFPQFRNLIAVVLDPTRPSYSGK